MNTRSRRTRALTWTILIAAVLTLGPVGCSKLPRKKWWQFWRPKSTETYEANKMVLPPPPDAAGGLGSGSQLPPPPDGSSLSATQPIRSGQTQTVPELRTVYFDYDSDQLTGDATAILDSNAQWLQSNPNSDIQLGGHCDARGSTEYNLNLGERRAKSVMAYLVGKGINAQRLHTISYGEENPAVPGDSEEAYAKNRRVDFLVYY